MQRNALNRWPLAENLSRGESSEATATSSNSASARSYSGVGSWTYSVAHRALAFSAVDLAFSASK